MFKQCIAMQMHSGYDSVVCTAQAMQHAMKSVFTTFLLLSKCSHSKHGSVDIVMHVGTMSCVVAMVHVQLQTDINMLHSDNRI